MTKLPSVRVGAILLMWLMMMFDSSRAVALEIGFDAAEGYAPGNLFGQPSAGTQWIGDDTSKIRVTAAQSVDGGQSVLIDSNADSGRPDNQLAVGLIPSRFSLKFFWRPSGTDQGDATLYLTEFEGTTTTAIGPYVQFVGEGAVYQIKYVENGVVRNILVGMDPAFYQDRWSEVEIVGDLASHTFDFYLNGTLIDTNLGFRNTLPASVANSLNYVSLRASTLGATDHYFDSIRIEAAPAVPTLSTWSVLGLSGLLAVSSLRLMNRRAREA